MKVYSQSSSSEILEQGKLDRNNYMKVLSMFFALLSQPIYNTETLETK